jgi:phosphoribosylformylglycinamidine cyclo-ligase
MNTDDLLCVGANNDFYLSNTIGRNAHRVDGQAIASVINGYSDIIDKLAAMGVNVVMTGGETADVGDLVQTIITDSTVVVRLKRSDVIYASNIKPGDVIVGLASSGKATYEDKENSGMGSNGLTAARHTLLHKDYLTKYPESVSNTIAEDKIYCGQYHLEQILPGTSLTVGEAILSPTRTYLPVMNDVFAKVDREKIHGMIHCTGGGLVKCKDFGENLLFIKDNLFDWPFIFREIYKSNEVPQSEMYQIFNMGHRLEVYCDLETAREVMACAKKFNVGARIVGRVEYHSDITNQVIIRDKGMEFTY